MISGVMNLTQTLKNSGPISQPIIRDISSAPIGIITPSDSASQKSSQSAAQVLGFAMFSNSAGEKLLAPRRSAQTRMQPRPTQAAAMRV